MRISTRDQEFIARGVKKLLGEDLDLSDLFKVARVALEEIERVSAEKQQELSKPELKEAFLGVVSQFLSKSNWKYLPEWLMDKVAYKGCEVLFDWVMEERFSKPGKGGSALSEEERAAAEARIRAEIEASEAAAKKAREEEAARQAAEEEARRAEADAAAKAAVEDEGLVSDSEEENEAPQGDGDNPADVPRDDG